MTLLCPKLEKARIGKTAGSETVGDKLGKMYDSSLSFNREDKDREDSGEWDDGGKAGKDVWLFSVLK
jgi:hypothetical protein